MMLYLSLPVPRLNKMQDQEGMQGVSMNTASALTVSVFREW
jgi:hypothetical protein